MSWLRDQEKLPRLRTENVGGPFVLCIKYYYSPVLGSKGFVKQVCLLRRQSDSEHTTWLALKPVILTPQPWKSSKELIYPVSDFSCLRVAEWVHPPSTFVVPI